MQSRYPQSISRWNVHHHRPKSSASRANAVASTAALSRRTPFISPTITPCPPRSRARHPPAQESRPLPRRCAAAQPRVPSAACVSDRSDRTSACVSCSRHRAPAAVFLLPMPVAPLCSHVGQYPSMGCRRAHQCVLPLPAQVRPGPPGHIC